MMYIYIDVYIFLTRHQAADAIYSVLLRYDFHAQSGQSEPQHRGLLLPSDPTNYEKYHKCDINIEILCQYFFEENN